MKETLRHQEAFEYYYSLGEKRNITKVAREISVCRASVSKWSRVFSWQQRVLERDAKNAKALAKKTDNDIQKRDAENIKIARAAIKVFAQSLIGHIDHTCECGRTHRFPIPKAKLTADQFDKMVRLEKFIIGEVDSRPEQVITIQYVDPYDKRKPVESKEIENEG